MPPRLTGAILAGGFSRRLGQDKAALQLGGKPLALWVNEALAHLVRQLLAHHQPAPGPPGLRAAPPDGFAAVPGTGRRPHHRAVLGPDPLGAGRGGGQPLSGPGLVERAGVPGRQTSRPAVVCRSPWGLEPFPGLYSVRLLPRLTEFLQSDRRPTRFLEVCRPRCYPEEEVRRLDPEGCSFFNLNTPGRGGPGRPPGSGGEPCRPGGKTACLGRGGAAF